MCSLFICVYTHRDIRVILIYTHGYVGTCFYLLMCSTHERGTLKTIYGISAFHIRGARCYFWKTTRIKNRVHIYALMYSHRIGNSYVLHPFKINLFFFVDIPYGGTCTYMERCHLRPVCITSLLYAIILGMFLRIQPICLRWKGVNLYTYGCAFPIITHSGI